MGLRNYRNQPPSSIPVILSSQYLICIHHEATRIHKHTLPTENENHKSLCDHFKRISSRRAIKAILDDATNVDTLNEIDSIVEKTNS